MFTIEFHGKPLKVWFEHRWERKEINERKWIKVKRYGVLIDIRVPIECTYELRSCYCHVVDATNDAKGVKLDTLPEITCGVAICNPSDNYVKETGRMKALRRAIRTFTSAEQRLFVAQYEAAKEDSRRKNKEKNHGNAV